MALQPKTCRNVLAAAFCAILGMSVLGACASPRLQIEGTVSQPSVTLIEAGVRLTLAPNTWMGYPSDLGRYFTPMQIKIENERTDEIRVRFGDFLALDEARNQYRAVPPAEVARALFGGRGHGMPGWAPARRPAPGPPLLAFSDPWWRRPYWPYPYRSPFFWPYYPFRSYDPDHAPGWPRTAAYDILTLALREGRVLPAARVEGFLYLQQATQKGNQLTLSWTPIGADGKPLATFTSRFQIVR